METLKTLLPTLIAFALPLSAAILVVYALKNVVGKLLIIVLALLLSGILTLTVRNGKIDLEYRGTSVTDTITKAGEEIGITGNSIKDTANQITDSMQQGMARSENLIQGLLERAQSENS